MASTKVKSNADIFAGSSPIAPESQGVFNLFNESASDSNKLPELKTEAISNANSNEEEKEKQNEKIEIIEY